MYNQKLSKFYDRMHSDCQTSFCLRWYNTFFYFSDFVNAPGVSSTYLSQSWKYFKNLFFHHEKEGL